MILLCQVAKPASTVSEIISTYDSLISHLSIIVGVVVASVLALNTIITWVYIKLVIKNIAKKEAEAKTIETVDKAVEQAKVAANEILLNAVNQAKVEAEKVAKEILKNIVDEAKNEAKVISEKESKNIGEKIRLDTEDKISKELKRIEIEVLHIKGDSQFNNAMFWHYQREVNNNEINEFACLIYAIGYYSEMYKSKVEIALPTNDAAKEVSKTIKNLTEVIKFIKEKESKTQQLKFQNSSLYLEVIEKIPDAYEEHKTLIKAFVFERR